MTTGTFGLVDDFELLKLMLDDSESQPPLYRPGPYWAAKARNAAYEIRRRGLADFRGSASMVGLSYADNLLLDYRDCLNDGLTKRLARLVTKSFPINRIFDAQVRWTASYASLSVRYAEELLNLKPRTRQLLKRYQIQGTLSGGCLAKATIDGQQVSTHYLDLLEQHDNIASRICFSKANSVFEIGGGFGINVHILLTNYKNIRKILYLDIPPNLYVGTQYLRALYGSAVLDYRSLRSVDPIRFSPDDRLEILCVAPWQIEGFQSTVDILTNSHSFVEMPSPVVQNYVDKFSGFPNAANAAVAFTTYDGFDLNTTFHPDSLPKFFKGRTFESFEVETLLDSSRRNLYYVSVGRFGQGQ